MHSVSAALLASFLAAGAARNAAAQAQPGQASPAPAMSTYHNEQLNLSYTYPSSYIDASSVVGPAFQASLSGDPAAAAQARCVSLPFSRMDSTGGLNILLLVHADAACLKKKFNPKSLAELTEGEAAGLTASGAKTDFGKPIPFEIDGHPATLLRGSFTLPAGQPMQAMVVCVLEEPDAVCWQFLSSSADRIATMSSYPVSLGKGPAVPLVPARLLPRP